MTDEQIALARRAVACQGWRWMPGMRATLSSGLVVRLGEHDEGSLWFAIVAGGATCTVDVRHPSYTVAPDLSDPATLGCLLALVREAGGDPEAHLALGAGGWILMSGESRVAEVVYPSPAGRTEAEALVAALEAAP